jgi:hypothetical protein
MNILFVIEYRANAGNTHAIANYCRVAAELGHTIAFHGPPQPQVVAGFYLPPETQIARFSTDARAFDRVIYLFESKLHRPKKLQEVALLGTIPRRHRYILDADARFNPFTIVDGYDRSHLDEAEREEWFDFYDALTDQIIKPTITPSSDPKVRTLPIFGFNPDEVIDPAKVPPKRWDILHVGHNWWRWKEVAGEILPAIEEIRDQVGEIAFQGMWWDALPDWAERMGLEPAFRNEAEKFRKLRIRMEPPVPYTDVIGAMSTGRINIFTQRPFLAHARHLTLRYFEEFCADTIPLLMLENDLAEAVYGPAARELVLKGRAAEKLIDALRRPDHYRGVVEDVRKHLLAHHSYRRRVEELVTAVSR